MPKALCQGRPFLTDGDVWIPKARSFSVVPTLGSSIQPYTTINYKYVHLIYVLVIVSHLISFVYIISIYIYVHMYLSHVCIYKCYLLGALGNEDIAWLTPSSAKLRSLRQIWKLAATACSAAMVRRLGLLFQEFNFSYHNMDSK